MNILQKRFANFEFVSELQAVEAYRMKAWLLSKKTVPWIRTYSYNTYFNMDNRASPRLLNNLPVHVWASGTLSVFRKCLKTYLFIRHFNYLIFF